MALPKQKLDIQLTGLNEQIDDKHAPMGSLSVADNIIVNKSGALEKRNGYTAITMLSDTGAARLQNESHYAFVSNSTLHYLDGYLGWTYRDSDTPGWNEVGEFIPIKAEQTVLYADHNTKYPMAYAYNDTTAVEAIVHAKVKLSNWDIIISLFDATSGALLAQHTHSDGTQYSCARIMAVGSYICLVYLNDSDEVCIARYDETGAQDLASTATATNATTTDTSKGLDIALINNEIYIAYVSSSSSNPYVRRWAWSTNSTSLVGSIAVDASQGLTIMKDNDSTDIWVAYCDASWEIYIGAWDTSLSSTVAAAKVRTLTSDTRPEKMSLTWYTDNSNDRYVACWYHTSATNSEDCNVEIATVTDAGGSPTYTTYANGSQVVSTAFCRYEPLTTTIDGYVGYCVLQHTSTYQSTYHLCAQRYGNNRTPFCFLNLSEGIATERYGIFNTPISVDNVNKYDDSKWRFIVGEKARAQTAMYTGTTAYAFNRVEIDFANPRISSTELGDITYIAPGGPIRVSQFNWFPTAGFYNYPEALSLTAATSGGSMADGTYSYMFVYVWRDNKGNIYRSAPSVAESVSVSGSGGNGKVTITMYNEPMWGADSNVLGDTVYTQVYRTTANGTIYYFVSETSQSGASDTITDTNADASITSNPQIYTTGAATEEALNTVPPSGHLIATYDNRLWVAGCADREKLYYSKEYVLGEGIGFNSDFVKDYEYPITAIAAMGNYLYVFSSNTISAITGTGPDSTGANSGFSDFLHIADDIGCTNERSVLVCDAGIFFESQKGLYHLAPTQQLTPLTAAEDYISNNTILSADIHPTATELRWVLDNGKILVFNYTSSTWTTHTPANIPRFSFVYDDKYWYSDMSGNFYYETADKYDDAGTQIDATLTTEWINLSQLNQDMRLYDIYVIGDYKSAHTLTVKVGYDYDDDTWTDTKTWNTATGLTGGDTLYQIRVRPSQQKCQAFRVSLTDDTQPTAGESFSVSGLSLVVGVKKPGKLNANKTI